MIQPAATSASSSLALTNGPQAAQGDDAPVSANFAALLGSNGPTAPSRADDPATARTPATDPTKRQAPGNVPGTKLPGTLPDADAIAASGAKSGDAEAGNGATAGNADPSLAPAKTEIILPGLVLPVAASMPQAAQTTPTAKKSTTEALAKAAAAIADPTTPSAKKPAKPGTNAAKQDKASDSDGTTDKAASSPVLPNMMPIAPVIASATAPAVTQAQPDAARSATTRPAAPLAAAAQTALAQPLNPAVAGNTPASPTVSPLKVAQPTTKASSQKAEVVIKPADAARTSAPDPASVAAGPQVQRIADAQAQDTTGAVRLAKGTDAPAAAPQVMTTADLQPVLAAPQTQPVEQAASQVTAAHAAAPIHQSGHDFTTLVDRLVEAREAAVPQPVHAAISHSEFGQVSLRFEHDGNGLSVAMSSADPDFARAVQASASSAQAQTSSDNGSAASRQDAQYQQQAAGSQSGQPHSQSQAFARDERSPHTPGQATSRSGAAANQQTHGDETTDTRGGIYA